MRLLPEKRASLQPTTSVNYVIRRARTQLDTLRDRYTDWYSNPTAQAEAAALWGGGCNEHGIFLQVERETLGNPERGVFAEVRITQAPNGLFAAGYAYRSAMGGGGRCPSVWSQPHATREEARRAAAREAIAGLEAMSDKASDNVRQALLKKLKQMSSQRSLFD
jgi:hypothetical protein